MKKYTYKKLDVNVYKHVCKNGLEVYLIPNKRVQSFYATLNVKFGSNILNYKVGEREVELPKGIAHFLEHKVFEQEDKETPFDFFSARGADCNASTSNAKTNYIFSGSSNYNECLNYLLDYVQQPYFTDENVLKEKGIIKQEILMYDDDPSQVLYNKSFNNTYKYNNIRYPIGGTVADIMSVTKEDLENAYEAFYQPTNMFLVVSGNIKIKDTIKLVEENQNKKKFKKIDVEIINKEDPIEINKKEETIIDDVGIPKVSLNIKVKLNDLNTKYRSWAKYLNLYLENVLGDTSLLKEKLFKEKSLTSEIYTEVVETNDYCSLLIIYEAEQYKKVLDKILNALKEYKMTDADMSLSKKVIKSSYVNISDNIYSINSLVANQILKYGKINEESYLDVDSMNEIEYNDIVSNVDLNNYSVVIVKSKLD